MRKDDMLVINNEKWWVGCSGRWSKYEWMGWINGEKSNKEYGEIDWFIIMCRLDWLYYGK